MSSRKISRTLVLTLTLSTAALSTPQAEAAQPRRAPNRTGTAIQLEASYRMLLQSLKHIFVPALGDAPIREADPPEVDPREGSGICPNGRPPGQHPGRN